MPVIRLRARRSAMLLPRCIIERPTRGITMPAVYSRFNRSHNTVTHKVFHHTQATFLLVIKLSTSLNSVLMLLLCQKSKRQRSGKRRNSQKSVSKISLSTSKGILSARKKHDASFCGTEVESQLPQPSILTTLSWAPTPERP